MPTEIRALVVTRDPAMADMFSGGFRTLGVETQSVDDLISAANPWLRSKVEAVVVDFDGLGDELSIFEELRRNPSNQNAIVIAVATHPSVSQTASANGAQFIVQRPFLSEQVHRAIRAAHGLMIQGRRRYFRLSASLDVSLIRDSGETIECKSINLSRNGMAVDTPQPLKVGESLTLSFLAPPSQADMTIRAVVVWDGDNHGKAGLRFGRVSHHVEEHLHAWLDDECLIWHKVS
jgi:DNA-binding response OmpR family regulator